MKIQFIAQSGFIITTASGQVITIDLWLKNPLHPMKLSDVPKTDYVFCTHVHGDHDLPTAIELSKRDNSWLIANYDVLRYAEKQGATKYESASIGGFYNVGDIEVMQTQAIHTSDIGTPVGFIIRVDGKTIYHMGDTAYFSTLQKMGEMYDIDVLMVPIGSRYTMGPDEASHAVADLMPQVVIPIHYNTFDKIKQDPQEFTELVKDFKLDTEVEVMEPGDILQI